jgi:hypothetical protein
MKGKKAMKGAAKKVPETEEERRLRLEREKLLAEEQRRLREELMRKKLLVRGGVACVIL